MRVDGLQPLQGERWAGTVAQQPLEPGPASASIRTEALRDMDICASHPWRDYGVSNRPRPGHPVRSFDLLRRFTGPSVRFHPLGHVLRVVFVEIGLTDEPAKHPLSNPRLNPRLHPLDIGVGQGTRVKSVN